MFHPTVVESSIQKLWDTWHPAALPRELTITEADDLTRRLAKAVDDKGNLLRDLSPEENALILNERLMCKASFRYWAERYAFISKSGETVERLYPFLETQEFILDRFAELELRTVEGKTNQGVLVNVLKGARQVGISTLAEVIAGYKFTQQSNLFGLVAADEPRTSAFMFDMFERIIERLPWWLCPKVVEHVKDSEMLFDTEAHIWVGSGKSTRGVEGQRGQLGRGRTLSFVHLSEISSWEDAGQIDGALLFAVPRSWRALVILESTALSRRDWWHKHWENSKEGGMSPAGIFECVFIPWYAARDLSKYSVPAPPGWEPAERTKKIAAIAEETSPRWMRQRVSLTRDQLYWYESTRAYYEGKDDMATFFKEVGAVDDDETFQGSGRSVFKSTVLQRIRENSRPLSAVLDIGPWAELKPGPSVKAN